MKKQYFFIIISLIISLGLNAQAPSNYYDAAEGKTTAELKETLSNIITAGFVSKSYDFLYTIYETSDRTDDGKLWDMYSTCTWSFSSYERCGNYHNICDCYNREHSIPQSWFGKAAPMKSDAFHVYPTDGKVNGDRSNLPYGETNGSTVGAKGLGKKGSCTFPGYSGIVFEPVDEYKGDFARTYFYFATRYENIMRTINGASFNGTVYPAFTSWSQNLFLKWHRQDPVSQKEINRNNAIYVYQKNRNPFIDHPELAEYIWGDKMGTPWTKNAVNTPHIESPTITSKIDFGNIPAQQSSSIMVTIKGAKLEGGLSLQISGDNASNFSLSTNSISKVDAENGYQLSISCTPQALGTLNAALVISGGGITATSYTITAISSDSFLALSATNVYKTGFTANWTSSAGASNYSLNVFTYENTGSEAMTILEEDFDDESALPSGWTTESGGYYSLQEESSNIRMGASKKNCVLITPKLDLSKASVLTIKAIRYHTDSNATITIEVDGNQVNTITTGANYETFTIELPKFTSSSEISLRVNKKRRVFLDYVKVATEGVVATPVSINGYPKLVGNVLSYDVTDLNNNSTYYYTVTPQSNGVSESNEITVKTLKDIDTGIINSDTDEEIIYYTANNVLYISNVEVGNKITLFDVVGRKVKDYQASRTQVSIPFEKKGIYILQVKTGDNILKTKKLILQ